MNRFRSHNCSELNEKDIGKKIKLLSQKLIKNLEIIYCMVGSKRLKKL